MTWGLAVSPLTGPWSRAERDRCDEGATEGRAGWVAGARQSFLAFRVAIVIEGIELLFRRRIANGDTIFAAFDFAL